MQLAVIALLPGRICVISSPSLRYFLAVFASFPPRICVISSALGLLTTGSITSFAREIKIRMTEKPRIRKITAVSWVICAQTLLLASSGQVALAAGQDTARTANAAATTVTAATTTAKLPGYSDDERTLRQQAVDYAKFYAARDAKSLASMWTTDGTFTDSKGHEYAGRTAIEDYFRDGFSGGSPQTLDVSVTSIKFPAPGVAIEEGTTRIASGPGMGSMGRYWPPALKPTTAQSLPSNI
jgi:uncharacterized protein (TIGR02246 family)